MCIQWAYFSRKLKNVRYGIDNQKKIYYNVCVYIKALTKTVERNESI